MVQERDGLRALCAVWEGRWREERRGRERAEGDLGSLRSARGRVLNDKTARGDTALVGLRERGPPLGAC